MNQLITTLDLYFGKKAPQMPTGLKEFLVKVAPYLSVLGVLLIIPAILILLGLSSRFGGLPYAAYGVGYGGFGITAIFSIILVVLYILAIPGLFKRSPSGWNFMFYAVLVGAVQNLLSYNLIGLLVGLAISFYILFQIRSYYFGGATMTSPTSQPPASA